MPVGYSEGRSESTRCINGFRIGMFKPSFFDDRLDIRYIGVVGMGNTHGFVCRVVSEYLRLDFRDGPYEQRHLA